MVSSLGSQSLMNTSVLVMRGVPVVLCQQVCAPVTVEIAPHAVNVIGVVLRIVVLDQKSAALHAVVVTFTFLQPAHPGKFDPLEARLTDLVKTLS